MATGELLLLGSGTAIYQADAIKSGGSEVNYQLRCTTKAYTPLGPSGDCVFRRAYLAISHTNGYRLRITPVLDGLVLEDIAQIFASAPSTTPTLKESVVLELPIMRTDYERDIGRGARGSGLQLIIESMPIDTDNDGDYELALFGELHIEALQIMYLPGSTGV